jgi:hypothetical protein
MTTRRRRLAILFPADAEQLLATKLEQSRFADIAGAFRAAGADVAGAPFADYLVDEVHAQLLSVDGVLVWFNPIEGGRDRTILNAMLRDVASKGIQVSAHPDVIDRMGTKEVLHRTRSMSWGCDTRHYATADVMKAQLPASLASAKPRVLKQVRGQSGDGIWQVELAEPPGRRNVTISLHTALRVRHAKRGSVEESMTLSAFLSRCLPYFASGGSMIDQQYQSRLPEGMVRCYVVGDQVAGFGEQLVNALYPAPPGALPSDAPQPGPRHYFPPTRPDFQRLKDKLEREWIAEMCGLLELDRSQLPVLWDADFLYGPKDPAGADTFVLCEINVSSVYPFPQDALQPLVANTLGRIKGNR